MATFDALGIGLVFPLILALVDATAVERVELLERLSALLGTDGQRELVEALGLTIGALFVLKNVVSILLVRWQFRLISRAEADAGVRLLQRYLTCSWPSISQRNSSELIRNASTSTSQVFLSVIVPSLTLCVEGLVALALLAVLLTVEPLVALTSLGLISVFAGGYFAGIRRILSRTGEMYQEALFGLLNHLKQGILAGREIRVLDRRQEFLRQLTAVRGSYAVAQARVYFFAQAPRYYLETVLVVLVLVAISLTLATRSMTDVAPVIAVLGVAALRLTASASRLLAAAQQVRIGLPALQAVHRDLCQLDSEDLQPAPIPATSSASTSEETGLILDHVTFAYSDRPAVKEVSLAISWGESVGVVGPSGSGKSTLIDLILGLLTPQAGTVLVDGRDQRSVMAAWRARIGYVPQHIYLTDDSLRRNIAFGLHDAEINEAKVLAAVQMADLESTVESLPHGLDALVGEHGTTLSGGQRQRVGIARALYHDPDVLILDEATSALDNETERTVIEAVESLRGRKTVIVVAHRLTTVRRCDRIVLMSEGRVTATGGFAELARDNPDFARLVELGRLPEEASSPGEEGRGSGDGGS
ncbi:MAG: ABC transporter ATP-binding protein [Kiloniellales bacterium]